MLEEDPWIQLFILFAAGSRASNFFVPQVLSLSNEDPKVYFIVCCVEMERENRRGTTAPVLAISRGSWGTPVAVKSFRDSTDHPGKQPTLWGCDRSF